MLGKLGDGRLDQRHIQRLSQGGVFAALLVMDKVEADGLLVVSQRIVNFVERDIRGMQKAGRGGALGFVAAYAIIYRLSCRGTTGRPSPGPGCGLRPFPRFGLAARDRHPVRCWHRPG